MGFGFSCLQQNRIVETSKISHPSKCNHVMPPPPPRRRRTIPPPPPRATKKPNGYKSQRQCFKRQIKHKMSVNSVSKQSKFTKRHQYPNKFKSNKNLNIPSNKVNKRRSAKHRNPSISNSRTMTASYISALSPAVSPAVSVISALSQAPPRGPFSITATSNLSHHSEVEDSESSSESSVSVVTAEHDTTASSLHSMDDGYSLINPHNQVTSEQTAPSKPTNMMQYVIQIEMEKKLNTKKKQCNANAAATPSSSIADSLLESQCGDTDSVSDDDCHECHEYSLETLTDETDEDDDDDDEEEDEDEDEDEIEQDHEVLSSHMTSHGSPNHVGSNYSGFSAVSALSHYSGKCDIFHNHLSVTSQLSELSELSAAKVDFAVTPRDALMQLQQSQSPKKCYGRIIAVDAISHDMQIYEDKIGDIGQYLEGEESYDDYDDFDDFDDFDEGHNAEYVD